MKNKTENVSPELMKKIKMICALNSMKINKFVELCVENQIQIMKKEQPLTNIIENFNIDINYYDGIIELYDNQKK